MTNMNNIITKETDMREENKNSLINIVSALCIALTKVSGVEFNLNSIDNGDVNELNKLVNIITETIKSSNNPILALGDFETKTDFDIGENLEEFNRILREEKEWCDVRGFKPLKITLYKHILWLKGYENCSLTSSYGLTDWTKCKLYTESPHYVVTADEKIIDHGFKHYFKIMLKQEQNTKRYQSPQELFQIILNDD